MSEAQKDMIAIFAMIAVLVLALAYAVHQDRVRFEAKMRRAYWNGWKNADLSAVYALESGKAVK